MKAGPRLLLVDDNPDNLFVMEQVIREILPECSVVPTLGARQGLALAALGGIDGALVDVQMPEIDGVEMCRRLKADERTAPIPVILITAHRAPAALKARGLEAGADDFIARPVDNLELAARLRVMLRIKRGEDELRQTQEELRRVNLHLEELVETRTRQLEEARDAAVLANRAKGEFLANTSHEIRTPLNGVIGLIALALEKELDAEQREYLSLARESADHLLRVIDDVLDFSKIEAGKLTLEEVPFELAPLLRTTIQGFSPEARSKGLALRLEISPDTPERVAGDPGRLRQVLVNLIGNAMKFTKRGSVEVSVRPEIGVPPPGSEAEAEEVAARPGLRARSRLLFSVRDTGIGIAPDNVCRLFQSFSQADSSTTREYGGTGLGLAICKRIVERMEGRLWVESEEGRGSTFRFSLPFPVASASEEAPPASRRGRKGPVAPPAPTEAGLRVLVAEDNPVNRLVATTFLQKRGWEVTAVADGREAVSTWETCPFDVILMDVQMPVLDGFEATRAIREKEAARGGRTPIIALTAHAMKEDRERCLAAGMDGYLSKPLAASELYALIEEVVSRLQGARTGPSP